MAASRIGVMWRTLAAAADGHVWTRLGVAAFAATLASIVASLAPLALARTVDHLDAAGGASGALGLAFIYVAALVAGKLLDQTQVQAFATADERLRRRLGAAALRHLMSLPMRFHLDRQVGELAHAHMLASDGVRQLVGQVGFTLAPALLQMAIILIVAAEVFDSALWLLIGIAMVSYAAVFSWSVGRLGGPNRDAVSAEVDASGQFLDALASVEAIKGAVAERRLGDRYDTTLARAERLRRLAHARLTEGSVLVALVFAASMAGALILGLQAFAAGRISVGGVVLLNAYLLQIVRPMEMTGLVTRELAQLLGSFEKWREILLVPPELAAADRQGRSERIHSPPHIRFEAVSFCYEKDRPILSDVSFEAPAGSVLAVVGPSGAGKSSLLRLLLCHEQADRGRILIGGVEIGEIGATEMRRMIALVNQDVVLFNDTLNENLLFASPDATPDDLARAIRLARLEGLVSRLPEGLDTRVGERGLRLSGGERQRVAIARAILRNAPAIVFDEATSAQDADIEAEIIEGLFESAGGRTMLIVTHRLALSARADFIVVLADGFVVERGTHADLVASDGAYARLWRLQTSGAGRNARRRGQATGAGAWNSEASAAPLRRTT